MEKLLNKFINLKKEFINTKGSEKSVENLYDIIYLLKEIEERNFEENCILTEIYYLIGKDIFALKIIESTLLNAKGEEIEKLKSLKNKIDSRTDKWNVKIYRDLRNSKLIKNPTKLKTEDFIIEIDIDNSYCLKISPTIDQIVILNKNFKNGDGLGDCYVFSNNKPDESLLISIIDYIEWLGKIKGELLTFYNDSNINYKINNVGQEWFDGLNIFDFSINIDNSNNFETEIILHDYLQNDFGFRLEIENRKIRSVEYDPIL